MRSFFQPFVYHLRNLGRFSGRDPRKMFWPWAIGLMITTMMVMTAVMIPAMVRMTALARQYPERSQISVGPGTYSVQINGHVPEMAPIMTTILIGVAIIAAVNILLLAASVTRRLHDRGKSGLWGLLPLPFLATGLVLMPMIFGSIERDGPPMNLFFAGFFNNIIYLATLGYLIFLLARSGERTHNRFGPPPDLGA